MQKILVLLFLTVNIAVAQNETLNDSILKPGIYLSLESVINNQPVEYSNLKVGEKEFEYKLKKTLKYNTAYYLRSNALKHL
ncbi:MAG: hypothetical protein L3J14_05770 [Flavobacteriaceae bacterium]|nr:hypothetical protein [Flavobacteriaceae bacterium]